MNDFDNDLGDRQLDDERSSLLRWFEDHPDEWISSQISYIIRHNQHSLEPVVDKSLSESGLFTEGPKPFCGFTAEEKLAQESSANLSISRRFNLHLAYTNYLCSIWDSKGAVINHRCKAHGLGGICCNVCDISYDQWLKGAPSVDELSARKPLKITDESLRAEAALLVDWDGVTYFG